MARVPSIWQGRRDIVAPAPRIVAPSMSEIVAPSRSRIVLPPSAVAPSGLQAARLEALGRRLHLGRQIRKRTPHVGPVFDDPPPAERARLDAFMQHVKAVTDDESKLLRAPFSQTAVVPPHRLIDRMFRGVRAPTPGLGSEWGGCDRVVNGFCVDEVTAEELELRELADEARALGNRQRNARREFIEDQGVDGLRGLYRQRRDLFGVSAERNAARFAEDFSDHWAAQAGGPAAAAAAAARAEAAGYAGDALALYQIVRMAQEGDHGAAALAAAIHWRSYLATAIVEFTTYAWPGVQQLLWVPIEEFMATMSAWVSEGIGEILGASNVSQIGGAQIGLFIFVCQIGYEFLAVPFMQWLYGDEDDLRRYRREAAQWAHDAAVGEYGYSPEEAAEFVLGQEAVIEYASGRFYEIVDDVIGAECNFVGNVCYAFTLGLLDSCPNCIDVAFDVARDHVNRPLKEWFRDELRGALLEGSIGGVGRRAEYGWVPPGSRASVFSPPQGAEAAYPGARAATGSGGGLMSLIAGGGLLYAALSS